MRFVAGENYRSWVSAGFPVMLLGDWWLTSGISHSRELRQPIQPLIPHWVQLPILGPVRTSFKFSNSCHSHCKCKGVELEVQHQQLWPRLLRTAGPLSPEHKLRAGEGVHAPGLCQHDTSADKRKPKSCQHQGGGVSAGLQLRLSAQPFCCHGPLSQ